jgi:hypothetical protein
MPNRPFCAPGPGRRMRVDGPLDHIEQARWRHRPGNRGGRKPQTAHIASRQAGPSHKAPLNHIADLEHAANKPCFGTPTRSLQNSVRARSSTATGQSTPDGVTVTALRDRRDGCGSPGQPPAPRAVASRQPGPIPGPSPRPPGTRAARASRSHVHSPGPSRPAAASPDRGTADVHPGPSQPNRGLDGQRSLRASAPHVLKAPPVGGLAGAAEDVDVAGGEDLGVRVGRVKAGDKGGDVFNR